MSYTPFSDYLREQAEKKQKFFEVIGSKAIELKKAKDIVEAYKLLGVKLKSNDKVIKQFIDEPQVYLVNDPFAMEITGKFRVYPFTSLRDAIKFYKESSQDI